MEARQLQLALYLGLVQVMESRGNYLDGVEACPYWFYVVLEQVASVN